MSKYAIIGLLLISIPVFGEAKKPDIEKEYLENNKNIVVASNVIMVWDTKDGTVIGNFNDEQFKWLKHIATKYSEKELEEIILGTIKLSKLINNPLKFIAYMTENKK